jgi:hypothetical protein
VENAAGLETPTDVQIQSLDRDLPHYSGRRGVDRLLKRRRRLRHHGAWGWGRASSSFSGTGESKTVENGAGNRGLFIGADKSPKIKTLSLTSADKSLMKANGEALPYDAFVSLVKKTATP